MSNTRIVRAPTPERPDPAPAEVAAAAAKPAASGGVKAWLPLLANIVLMPVLAYVMTAFVLLPKLKSAGPVAAGGAESGEHSGAAAGSHGGAEAAKVNVPLSNKVLVNLSGTMGTRYLLANITLVGGKPELKETVEKKDAQLRDVAASVLGNKTIADIDKPGARNLLRTELVSAFNTVLGSGSVSEIFFTEFAIQ
ncbi:MAG: flagellar basal body-associated FliL family protein [Verrucomicrobia bacterium]|nr:flagellar basal body-associated FliL family protein [Verrucomicrobiota bacterium]